MSDNPVMNQLAAPGIPGYNNALLIAGEGLSIGVNNINTKIIGHRLFPDMPKSSEQKGFLSSVHR